MLSAVAAAVFLLTQARGRHPMVPPALFHSATLRVALVIAFTSMAAFYGTVFVQSLYFQQLRDQTPLQTGLLFLPMTALVTVTSAMAARLIARFGRRALITGGLTVQCLGLLLLVILPVTTSVWLVAAAMVPVGVGGALTVPPIASLVLDAAPQHLAGTASGVLNTSRQLGGSLGVAVVGALIASQDSFQTGMRIGLGFALTMLAATALLSLTVRESRPTTPAGSTP